MIHLIHHSEIMLKRTVLTKQDTCFTYAIKRVGLETKLKFLADLPKEAIKEFDGDYKKLQVGDIIGWQGKNKYALLVNEISSIGGKPVIIENPVYVHIHLAVVEEVRTHKGEYLITVSDCVRKENVNSVPEIRLKLLSLRDDAPKETEVRLPDIIIIKSKLKEL